MALGARLKKLHDRQARALRREVAAKLQRQVGIDGRRLPSKVIPNDRPLGYGESASGIPGRVRRAPFKAFQSGFVIQFAANSHHLGDLVFHTGRANQRRRPIYGLSQAQQDRFFEEFQDEVAKELRALGVVR